MNGLNLLGHYDYQNAVCLNDSFYNPQDEVCIDKRLPITKTPLDRGYSREYKPAIGERRSGFDILVGCSSPNKEPDPPKFENPDISLISKSGDERAGRNSHVPVLSLDGRYLAFTSWATDLIDDDDNKARDVFIYDHSNDSITRASLSSDGEEANDDNAFPSISADGKFVSFTSAADNLVSHDTNDRYDIFVRDVEKKKTERVNISSNGEEANGDSYLSQISADGRYVTFNSGSTNLVPFGTTGIDDVFVYDRQTKKISRTSISNEGWEANGSSGAPSISGDGSLVVFGSWADNLTSGDDSGYYDIFLRNLATSATILVSAPPNTGQANGNSSLPNVSQDGQSIAFISQASNLKSGDNSDWWKLFVADAENGKYKKCSGLKIVESMDEIYGTKISETGFLSITPKLSEDGKFVVFSSEEQLTADDSNDVEDVYVCDTDNGDIKLVSRSTKGKEEINGGSKSPSISSDGSFIAFSACGDPCYYSDVFLAKNPLFKEGE